MFLVPSSPRSRYVQLALTDFSIESLSAERSGYRQVYMLIQTAWPSFKCYQFDFDVHGTASFSEIPLDDYISVLKCRWFMKCPTLVMANEQILR